MNSPQRGFSLGQAVAVVVPAGLACALADIGYVIGLVLHAGGSPSRMLQGIASSVLGRATFDGGAATAALGLALHTGVSLGAATLFYAACRVLPVVRKRWLIGGVVFGALFYVLMQLAILPLTRLPPHSFPPPNWVPIFIAHITVVGPVIAFVTQRRMGRLAANCPS